MPASPKKMLANYIFAVESLIVNVFFRYYLEDVSFLEHFTDTHPFIFWSQITNNLPLDCISILIS